MIEELPEDGFLAGHYDPFDNKIMKQKINEMIRELNTCYLEIKKMKNQK